MPKCMQPTISCGFEEVRHIRLEVDPSSILSVGILDLVGWWETFLCGLITQIHHFLPFLPFFAALSVGGLWIRKNFQFTKHPSRYCNDLEATELELFDDLPGSRKELI